MHIDENNKINRINGISDVKIPKFKYDHFNLIGEIYLNNIPIPMYPKTNKYANDNKYKIVWYRIILVIDEYTNFIIGMNDNATPEKNSEIKITIKIDLILFTKKFCLFSKPYNSVKESLNLLIPLDANHIDDNMKIIIIKISGVFQFTLSVKIAWNPGIK